MGFWGWIEIREGFTRFERLAVLGSKAILINGGGVGFGTVANILGELVFGILRADFCHVMIAGDFGDNRSSGDFADFGIAFDAGGGVWF